MLKIKRIRVKDDAVWEAGRALAEEQGRTISWLLLELLRQHVEMRQRAERRKAYIKELFAVGGSAGDVISIIKEMDRRGEFDEKQSDV